MATTKPQAQVELSISVSPKELSLSNLEQELSVSVTAKTISSSKPKSAVTFNARWTALDDEEGVRKGVISATTIPDEHLRFHLAFPGRVNYTVERPSEDLRECEFWRFVVVPALDSGDTLTVIHKLTVGRLFQNERNFKVSDIKPGTQIKFCHARRGLDVNWWSFEDEAGGKKLYDCIYPGDPKLRGEGYTNDTEAVEKRQSEGWMHSHPLEDLSGKMNDDNDDAICTFVE